MEYAPTPESIEDQPPNVVAFYKGETITLFGITGTLDDLMSMCNPRNLTDPEANDRVAIKALNESGVTVDPAHEAHFTKVLEEEGIERKFMIAPKANKEQITPPEAVTQKPVVDTEIAKPISKRPDTTKVTTPPVLERNILEKASDEPHETKIDIILKQEAGLPIKVVAQTAIAEIIDLETVRKAQRMDVLLQAGTQEVISPISDNGWDSDEVAASNRTTIESRIPMESIELQHEATEVEMVDTSVHEVVLEDYDPSFVKPIEENLSLPSHVYEAADTYAAFRVQGLEAASSLEIDDKYDAVRTLAGELAKEPADLYEDFVAATEHYLQTYFDEQQAHADFIHETETVRQDMAPLAAILEHMQSVDDGTKAQVAETVRELIGVVHGLAVLELRPETPVELKEQIQAQIVAICENLCEELGPELSEDDVQALADIFQQPDFIAGFITSETRQPIDKSMREELPDSSSLLNSRLSGFHLIRELSRIILTLPAAA